MPVTLREQAKGVHEARVDEVLKARTLFVGEPLLAAVRFRVGQVEFGMRYIEVAAENDRLALFQLFAVGQKCRVPMFEAQLPGG